MMYYFYEICQVSQYLKRIIHKKNSNAQGRIVLFYGQL